MKRIVALVLAAMMVLSLTSCQSAAPKDEKIELSFLVAEYSTKTGEYIQNVINKFQEKNPNVHVTLEIVGWDNLSTRVNTLVGAKQAPDMYAGGTATQFIPDNLVYKPEDILSKNLCDDFAKQFWDNNFTTEYNGVYQIPFLASVRALYYNKKIFNEVGIAEAPKTWKEVEEVCQKIKDFYNGDVYAWGVDGTTTEGQTVVAYYGWNNGGGYVDANDNYMLNDPKNVEAYEWVKSLIDKGYTNANPTIETRDDMQKLVVADKMAMLVTACFFPSLYPDADLGVAAIPYNDANVSASSTLGVQDCVCFFNGNAKAAEDSDAKKKAIADFMDFFYAPENYVGLMIQEGMIPATNSGVKELAVQKPEQAAYVDVLAGAKFYSRAKSNWQECSAGCCDVDQKVFTGAQSAKDALDELQALLTK
ncbi:MAG: extracellular solute-binding protein [Eubacteriales bacterium]|nr:extracellular solute-binding protein [Eubacteriales bacterium]